MGTAFPLYKQVMGRRPKACSAWARGTARAASRREAYFDAHVKKFNKEPDRWASGASWASLEILQSAVGKVGLDRKAIRDYVANNTHDTVIGKIKFNGSENVATPGSVSQWQKGEFEVVWPKSMATGSLTPKPAWV